MPPRVLTQNERETRDARGRSHLVILSETSSMLDQLRRRAQIDAAQPHTGWAAAIELALMTAREDPDPHAIVWWVARIGHWIGACLAHKYAGHWYLDENPEGQTFLRSVVGAFGLGAADVDVCACTPRYDPFRMAATVFAEHLNLVELLDEIHAELIEAGVTR